MGKENFIVEIVVIAFLMPLYDIIAIVYKQQGNFQRNHNVSCHLAPCYCILRMHN